MCVLHDIWDVLKIALLHVALQRRSGGFFFFFSSRYW
jgi:hypothetical protein